MDTYLEPHFDTSALITTDMQRDFIEMATMSFSLRNLRRPAVASALFPETTLNAAIDTLSFVQADRIRAPARAQDHILGLRVKDYRVGDLDANFSSLQLEEDFLYVYGFVPQATWQLLHPRYLGVALSFLDASQNHNSITINTFA